jgi:hypothetical protein
MKIPVGVALCFAGAVMTSGCVVRSDPVVVRPAPTVVVQPVPVIVYQPVPVYKYKHKRKHGDEDDQGENEQ